MKKERNIGEEILAGIKEIKDWQQGKRKLKVTHLELFEQPSGENSKKIEFDPGRIR